MLGAATHDVCLNNSACWSNVPEKVWDYTIGGYQVIKKWLSYREFALLGRALTPEEVREVSHIARRIAALILLEPELDANYLRVKGQDFRLENLSAGGLAVARWRLGLRLRLRLRCPKKVRLAPEGKTVFALAHGLPGSVCRFKYD